VDGPRSGSSRGGALGNVADRLRHGAVTDFLDFHAAGHHWPAFNLADTAIVVGVALLVVAGGIVSATRPFRLAGQSALSVPTGGC
jgi:hypothetical protein